MMLTLAFALLARQSSHPRKLENVTWLRENCCIAVAVVGNDVCVQGGDEDYYDLTELITRRGKRVRLMEKLGYYFVGGANGLLYYSAGGHIYVVNERDKDVRHFGSLGSRRDQFSKQGMLWGNDFPGPQHLAVGPKGDVYASDQGTHSIKHFDANGKFLASITSDTLKSITVTGLAADPSDNVYAACRGNDKPAGYVVCLAPSGKVLRKFGSMGDEVGQFLPYKDAPSAGGPNAVAIGPDGSIYVGDPGGAEIEVYDPTGKPLKSLAIEPRGGIAYSIYALAVDKQGTLYAATSSGLCARRRH